MSTKSIGKKRPSELGAGQRLYEHAKELIPGGTQLLSKRPEMFLGPGWPAYYSKAKGVKVWDLDGTCYIDAAQIGVGAPVLGFADPDVDSAVVKAIKLGTACSLNCPEEVELAELLIEIHPWAEMVRFGRGGGEIMAIAIRIARAATGREKIAFSGYHGWHDWYLAANLSDESSLDGHLLPGLQPLGVPRGLRGTMLPFRYNQIEELRAIEMAHGKELAAIVMEPARDQGPNEGFLEEVRRIADRCGAVLIFDEVTSGFRVNSGGIHLTYGVNPDLAAFAKALGNGYPAAAVIGKRSVMDSAQRTFISSTNWTERIGPTAALAMIRKHRRFNVGRHLTQVGKAVQQGWVKAAKRANLKLKVSGIAPLGHFEIICKDPAPPTTLFIQEMLQRGFLASNSFYASYCHEPSHVERYLAACEEVFSQIADALRNNTVSDELHWPPKHMGFKRLT